EGVPGLPAAPRGKEARQRRSPGRRNVSGRDDGVEFVGRWRRRLGTHGRAGTATFLMPDVSARLRKTFGSRNEQNRRLETFGKTGDTAIEALPLFNGPTSRCARRSTDLCAFC